MCVCVCVWVCGWGGRGLRLFANLPAPGARRPHTLAGQASEAAREASEAAREASQAAREASEAAREASRPPRPDLKLPSRTGGFRAENRLPEQQKKGPENMKSGLNGVARPRFGPILSGNVAVDSLMLLVASEPSKTL